MLEEVLSHEPDVEESGSLKMPAVPGKPDNQGIEFGPDLTAYAKGNPGRNSHKASSIRRISLTDLKASELPLKTTRRSKVSSYLKGIRLF